MENREKNFTPWEQIQISFRKIKNQVENINNIIGDYDDYNIALEEEDFLVKNYNEETGAEEITENLLLKY
jgi:hypothetical protein